MLRIWGIHIFLLVANCIRSLFEWYVTNDAITKQHACPNEAVDTGPQIQINMQSLRQTQDRVQSRETSPEIARETQSDVTEERMDCEAGLSASSQNEAEADAASTPEVYQSSPSRNRAQAEDTQTGLWVALWVGCVAVAVLFGLMGSQITSSSQKHFFKAFMIPLCASFASGICIFLLKILRPNNQCLAVVVKILIIAVIGSTSLVFGLGVTYYFRKA